MTAGFSTFLRVMSVGSPHLERTSIARSPSTTSRVPQRMAQADAGMLIPASSVAPRITDNRGLRFIEKSYARGSEPAMNGQCRLPGFMGRAIDTTFERRLSALVNAREPGVLQGGLKGVERESLRVHPDGSLAHSPHPAGLGSALTNEHV